MLRFTVPNCQVARLNPETWSDAQTELPLQGARPPAGSGGQGGDRQQVLASGRLCGPGPLLGEGGTHALCLWRLVSWAFLLPE